ncbi:hypothetical protein F5148DRAFT_476570 [Russula earlei]|uniref:Uncharacterized protein n=1 Tax=Russula earlei TaxID=71964 RepID=A0ACC0TYF8_9AGAM|nr:hypothetical protein F5148DRAFT_476570 [Russula earlei]
MDPLSPRHLVVEPEPLGSRVSQPHLCNNPGHEIFVPSTLSTSPFLYKSALVPPLRHHVVLLAVVSALLFDLIGPLDLLNDYYRPVSCFFWSAPGVESPLLLWYLFLVSTWHSVL